MDAGSQHGGHARPPWLQSWAAKIGVAILVGLSIFVGVRFWWPRDQALAILTIGAEIIAFAGLGTATWQWARSRRVGFGAVVVTLIAAGWCAFTMFQNIAMETREEAVRRAQERPQYVFAKNAADLASSLLSERLTHPNPRPQCTCPQTIREWEAAEAASIDRLRNERDVAVGQMEAAIPPPQMDWLALARGIGVEIAKLFGFVVFSLSLAPLRHRKRPPDHALVESQPEPQPPWQPVVVEGGRSAGQPTSQPALRPKPRAWWLGLKTWANGAVGSTIAVAHQPAALPLQPISTTPLNHPAERVVERTAAPVAVSELPRIANQMAADKVSERGIAKKLSDRYGERITRYQVRVWLGRESRAA